MFRQQNSRKLFTASYENGKRGYELRNTINDNSMTGVCGSDKSQFRLLLKSGALQPGPDIFAVYFYADTN